MKGKIAIIMSAILVFMLASVLVIGLTRKRNDVLVVNEVTHSIFYAPFYIAINNGYFEEEGIEIELINGGGSNNSMTALLGGSADVVLVGPETTVYVERSEMLDQPKMFGQLTKRDGAMVISKTATDNFAWTDMIGETVIGGRRGGMPAMTLQYAIEQIAGLQIGTESNQVNLRNDVEFNLVGSVYESTDAEYCVLFEPTASAFVEAGKGYAVASVGQESGEVPYTGFVAKQSYLLENEDTVKGFLRAVVKGYNYLIESDIDDVVEALYPSFNTTPKTQIKAAVQTYISIDAWMSSPVMAEADFDFLQDIMINAGELEEKVSFSEIVYNTYAIEVMEEFA